MWVEEAHEQAVYFQHSANLSAGGIFLDRTVPHPIGTRVQLQFTLPGDSTPLRVQAEIVNMSEGELGMGMRFVDPPADLAARIGRFIDEHGAE
jgi:uncharacterized protein (TIGR02266 family)